MWNIIQKNFRLFNALFCIFINKTPLSIFEKNRYKNNFFGGEGGVRTLAPRMKPNSLANYWVLYKKSL